MDSLKGKLLISSGGLYDPNFRHTVVLVGEHGPEEGAVGVVLTRPFEATVAEAVPSLATLVDADEVLFEGGPVEQERAVLLAEVDEPGILDVPAFGSVGFLTDDVAEAVRPHVVRARVFLGHAGWAPGQLEAEMDQDAWIVAEARADDVFTDSPGDLWHRVLRRMGPPFATMARIPFDPSVN